MHMQHTKMVLQLAKELYIVVYYVYNYYMHRSHSEYTDYKAGHSYTLKNFGHQNVTNPMACFFFWQFMPVGKSAEYHSAQCSW